MSFIRPKYRKSHKLISVLCGRSVPGTNGESTHVCACGVGVSVLKRFRESKPCTGTDPSEYVLERLLTVHDTFPLFRLEVVDEARK